MHLTVGVMEILQIRVSNLRHWLRVNITVTCPSASSTDECRAYQFKGRTVVLLRTSNGFSKQLIEKIMILHVTASSIATEWSEKLGIIY